MDFMDGRAQERDWRWMRRAGAWGNAPRGNRFRLNLLGCLSPHAAFRFRSATFRSFALNLLCWLVFAKAFEGCLSHKIVRGPSGKGYLRHQFRPYPTCTSPDACGNLVEGRLFASQLLKPIAHHAVRLLRKAGAAAPGVNKLAVAVIAQQQGAYSVRPI